MLSSFGIFFLFFSLKNDLRETYLGVHGIINIWETILNINLKAEEKLEWSFQSRYLCVCNYEVTTQCTKVSSETSSSETLTECGGISASCRSEHLLPGDHFLKLILLDSFYEEGPHYF